MKVDEAAGPVEEGAGAVKPSQPTRCRIILPIAAAIVLGWGGWFVWLVVTEIHTEEMLRDTTPRYSLAEIDTPKTIRDFYEFMETSSGVHIDLDLPPTVLGVSRGPRWGNNWIRERATSQGSPTARVLAFGTTLFYMDMEVYGHLGRRLETRIEGDGLVITTVEDAPRFDGSAWVRRRLHDLDEWWESP